MPPVSSVEGIPGIPDHAAALDARDVGDSNVPSPSSDTSLLSGRNEDHALAARTTDNTKPPLGQGTIDPTNINNQGLFALFAILGAAFVLVAIWFFFWAKNGGCIWRKGDWEDYKSTVLRRKGPDGRTLSNATKSTKLGGGSVVGEGYSDDGWTVTDTATTLTEKGEPKRKRRFAEAAKQKLLRRRRDEEWEGEADEDVRAYRQERPARVGGMNRQADGTYHGSDYDTSNPASSYNQSEMSQVRDYAYQNPARQSRNFSFQPGSEDVLSQTTGEERDHQHHHQQQHHPHGPRREEPAASEVRRHNRRRERRRNPPPTSSSRQSSPRKRGEIRSVPGHYTEPLDFSSSGTRSEYQYTNVETDDESGTKSYHHPIPGLGKGYRREGGRGRRRDSLSDSDGD
jgi:hypothetical protein